MLTSGVASAFRPRCSRNVNVLARRNARISVSRVLRPPPVTGPDVAAGAVLGETVGGATTGAGAGADDTPVGNSPVAGAAALGSGGVTVPFAEPVEEAGPVPLSLGVLGGVETAAVLLMSASVTGLNATSWDVYCSGAVDEGTGAIATSTDPATVIGLRSKVIVV